MRSITDLGLLAYQVFPPAKGLPEIPATAYAYAIEDGWRQFVDRTGGIYHMTADTPIVIGTSAYTLPIDMRAVAVDAVYLSYRPRTISTVARESGVVTLVTTTDHDLAVGHEIKPVDVTAAGGTDFEVAGTVLTVPSATSITFVQEGDDDTGTGGTLEAAYAAKRLTLADRGDLDVLPDDQVDADAAHSYYYPSGRAIALWPPPNGRYPAVFMEYDALPPALLDRTAELPLPAVYERALMAYAAALVGGRVELMPLFEEGVRQWRAARSRREERNRL